MAGEAKAPDNRLFQLVMVIITSIVAPVTVYFITNSAKNAPAEPAPIQATVVMPIASTAEPTIQVLVVTATPQPTETPALTATLLPNTPTLTATLPPNTPTFTAVPPTLTFTPNVAARPGNVPAGTVVLADTFALLISEEDLKVEGDYLRLTIRVQNTGNEAKSLEYTLKAITVKDNTRHTYSHFNGEKSRDCKKQEIDKRRSVKIEPGETLAMQSPERENANWFCSGDHLGALPLYIGPIRKDAKQVLVQINGLGPFKALTVQIDR